MELLLVRWGFECLLPIVGFRDLSLYLSSSDKESSREWYLMLSRGGSWGDRKHCISQTLTRTAFSKKMWCFIRICFHSCHFLLFFWQSSLEWYRDWQYRVSGCLSTIWPGNKLSGVRIISLISHLDLSARPIKSGLFWWHLSIAKGSIWLNPVSSDSRTKCNIYIHHLLFICMSHLKMWSPQGGWLGGQWINQDRLWRWCSA